MLRPGILRALPAIAALTLGLHAPARAAQAVDAERYAKPGPWPVERRRQALCCDAKGNKIDLYLPRTSPDRPAPASGFPAITWGNGTWASPDRYDLLLRHLAYWGMVVVATRDASAASGDTLLDAVGLLARDRTLPPVDPARIGAAGHSQGAGGALNAAARGDPKLRTTVAISLPERRFCKQGDCAHLFDRLRPGASVLLMSGARDGLSPPRALAGYMREIPAGVGRAAAAVRGADHNDVHTDNQGQPGCRPFAFGCRQGIGAFLPYVTAWLRWRLADDRAAGALFDGADPAWRDDARLQVLSPPREG